MSGQFAVFLGWTSTKQRIKCSRKQHNDFSESWTSNPSIPNLTLYQLSLCAPQHKIIYVFLSIKFNIHFGCSKEHSDRDGSFEYPQHMFCLKNKKINFQSQTLIKRSIRNFLFLNQNIYCGYSKEPSQWDSSFKHPKQMFKPTDKKILINLRSNFIFIWGPVYTCTTSLKLKQGELQSNGKAAPLIITKVYENRAQDCGKNWAGKERIFTPYTLDHQPRKRNKLDMYLTVITLSAVPL